MKNIEHNETIEDRKTLAKLEANGYRDYNKTVLLLSAGAFGVSFFILDRMSNPDYILFLVYTWLFWAVALLMQMGSLSMYPKALREELLAEKEDTKQNRYFFMMHKLGFISTLAFGLGIFFFIVFVLYNLNCF